MSTAEKGIRVALTVLVSSIGLASNLRAEELTIRALIDGRSRLILRANTAYWHHMEWAAPGRHKGIEPTYFNSIPWFPEWPDKPTPQNNFCNCDSSRFDNLPVTLPQTDVVVVLQVAESRGVTELIQVPHIDNDFTLIIEFYDHQGGSTWYEVVVSFQRATAAGFIWSPRAPTVASLVRFEDRSEGATGWKWEFGDGTSSTERHASHSYASPGPYVVTLTVSNSVGSSSLSREVTVVEESTLFTPRLIVPGQARAQGAAGAFFRSALWATNLGDEPSVLRLRFIPSPGRSLGGGESLATFIVREKRSIAFTDVLTEAFGANEDTDGVIIVEVAPGAPIPVVTARTYNDTGQAGTLGQYVGAVQLEVENAGLAVVEGLRSDTSSRSNVGVVNLSPSAINASLKLFDESGASRGSELNMAIPAYSAIQVNRIADVAGVGTTLSLFRVEGTASGPFFMYASMLDNRTSDPILIPGNLRPRSLQYVDGVGSVTGSGGTRFLSSLVISNRNQTMAEVEIDLTPRGQVMPSHTATLQLEPSQTRYFADAFGELLGTESAGTLEFRTSQSTPMVVWARTYSELGSAGTLGQFIPAFGSGDLMPEAGAILQGLSHDQRYRTNLGLVNVGSVPVAITISLWSAEGIKQGERSWQIDSLQSRFIGAIIREFIGADLSNGYLLIRPSLPESIYAWASFVDNVSTDQTFVRPVSLPVTVAH